MSNAARARCVDGGRRGPYFGRMRAPILICSDAHLGAVPADAERAFLAFLERVPELSRDLLIDGDLFDFWFEYRSVVLREHFPVLRRLAALVDAGVRVRLVAGNHDAWGGAFLREEVGLELLEGPVRLTLAGRRALVAHGDGLAGGDLGYRLIKALIRSRTARVAFRWLHPDVSRPLVRRLSGTPDRGESGPGAEEGRARVLSAHAARLLREDPSLEMVVFGHAHRPELRTVSPGRHYLNPGDWIHHRSYALVGHEGIELHRWRGRPSEPSEPEARVAFDAERRA